MMEGEPKRKPCCQQLNEQILKMNAESERTMTDAQSEWERHIGTLQQNNEALQRDNDTLRASINGHFINVP